MRKRGPWAFRPVALGLCVLVAVLCALGLKYWPRAEQSLAPIAVAAGDMDAPDAGPPARAKPKLRPPANTKGKTDPACAPAAGQRCEHGDVWSVDGCGKLEEKLDECENRLCREGVCELEDEEPCDEPAEGRCERDRVRLCYAGRALTIDCARQGLRCAYGDEGAQCVPEVPANERCDGVPVCEGDVLVQCELGRKQRIDCRAQRASCEQLADAAYPSCVTDLPERAQRARGCGPCGCAKDESLRETQCDGRDDDLDGLVDEELDCGPVPVIAFVVTNRNGQSSHGPDDVQTELARANQLFAASPVPSPLSFVLEDLVWLADDTLLDVDGKDFQRLVFDPRVHPARDHFYLPLVFTDTVSLGGETPKNGVSTLPNGTCGGLQESAGPDVGIVAVAKGRALTTVAHEIGHFFGLCHTHDKRTAAPRVVPESSVMAGVPRQACEPSCRDEGDGLCDTPFDPGPEQCLYDATCGTRCVHNDEPDPSNLMGYYTACRQSFSEDQMRLMQHSLALRRGWQPCLETACACELAGDVCPVGMSCRPQSPREDGSSTRCGLDGPYGPSADCNDTRQCGQGTLCIAEQTSGVKRCARPCVSSAPGCDCTPIGTELSTALSICIDDLTVGRR